MKRITRKLLALSSIAIASIFFSQTDARALSVSLDGGAPSGNVYNYSVTLDSDESIDTFDSLVFLNLAGVTNATASSPFAIDTNGFGSNDANFDVITNASGSQTLSSVIQITSTATVGTVNYDLFTGSGSFSGTVLGPSATTASVPFEFSPGLGIMMITSVFALNKLKNKFDSH